MTQNTRSEISKKKFKSFSFLRIRKIYLCLPNCVCLLQIYTEEMLEEECEKGLETK